MPVHMDVALPEARNGVILWTKYHWYLSTSKYQTSNRAAREAGKRLMTGACTLTTLRLDITKSLQWSIIWFQMDGIDFTVSLLERVI